MPKALLRRMRDCAAFRISPDDTNYMAIVFDPRDADCGLTAVVEIFEVDGSTPPNQHQVASEFFFVLQGQGRARADGTWVELRQGDALMVRPGTDHAVQNTGAGRLYCLTVMAPDEDFSRLIRNGTPVTLDAADRLVLGEPSHDAGA